MPSDSPAVLEPTTKPDKPTVDWQLIQTRYCQGVPSFRIAKEFGVTPVSVRQRARRGKWSHLRSAVSQSMVTASREVLKTERDAIAEESAQARKLLSSEVLAQAGNLRTTKLSRKLSTMMERGQLTRTIAETAKTVYGWDSSDAKRTIINVSVLDQLDQPVIDVTPSQPES